MNYKLIMLPNPILVSCEKPTEWYLDDTYTIRKSFTDDEYYWSKRPEYKKIIAGIEGLPSLDLSAIAEEIGWVDVEKLAEENADSFVWDFESEGNGYIDHVEGFKEGFKAAQSLNEKKYTNEHMLVIRNRIVSMLPVGEVNAWDMIKTVKEFTNWLDEYVESLSKPKEYNVEVEMEYYYMSSKEFYGNDADWIKCSKDNFDGIKREIPSCPLKVEPKITNNTIKVTKIINQI